MSKIKFQVPTHDPRPVIRPEYLREQKKEKEDVNKRLDKMPNQKWHQIISFIKSGIRIVGYIIIPYDLVIAASVLVFSEIIGIVEELV